MTGVFESWISLSSNHRQWWAVQKANAKQPYGFLSNGSSVIFIVSSVYKAVGTANNSIAIMQANNYL
jgi:hypothetical protein